MKAKSKEKKKPEEVIDLVDVLVEDLPKTSFTIEEVEEIKNELNDKYLRLFAEFDNYRKRAQKEKDDIRSSTKVSMLGTILDLDSDLSIAIKQDRDNKGLNLMISKINSFLTSQGVETIQTDTYDSDLHEVISVLEVGVEKIVDVVSKGYSISGKPFRFPKIILGK
jgi:molecular chaperone GrpE